MAKKKYTRKEERWVFLGAGFGVGVVIGIIATFLLMLFLLEMQDNFALSYNSEEDTCLIGCPEGLIDCMHEDFGMSVKGCLVWTTNEKADAIHNPSCDDCSDYGKPDGFVDDHYIYESDLIRNLD